MMLHLSLNLQNGSNVQSSLSPKSSPRNNELFTVQAEKALFIYIYRNGDKHHKGEKFVINKKKLKTLEQLILDATPVVKLVTGPIRRLYTTEGRQITDINQ